MSSAVTASRISDSSMNMWRTVRQKTKTRNDEVEEITLKAQAEGMPDTAPPPYTQVALQGWGGDPLSPNSSSRTKRSYSSSSPYPLLVRLVKKKQNDRGLLLWYIVEIMATTFSADFPKLQAAIVRSRSSWISRFGKGPSSILTEHHKATLAELCALVRDLEEKLRRNCWPAARQQDKDLIVKIVLEPAQEMQIDVEYVLEVLGRYKCFEASGVEKIETMVAYWTPSYPKIRPRWTSPVLDFGDTLASHASLITSLRLKKKQSIVLENAMATFRKNKGLEGLRNSKELQMELLFSGETCLWPLSDGYINLAKVLRTRAMYDYFMPSRQRLRHRRKYRSYFQFV